MPTIPKKVSMRASNIDLMNAIRSHASFTYQERIPVATQENIKETSTGILNWQPARNEFVNALFNRIGMVLASSRMFYNSLNMFKRGRLEYGETIEEYFVQVAKAHIYDPATAENEMLKREIPDIQSLFHKVNRKNFYKVTVEYAQLQQAFLAEYGISDMIGRIIDSLYSGNNYDEFLLTKQLVNNAATDGMMFAVTVPAITSANASSIATTIKGISNNLLFPSTSYNAMGVLTNTPREDQYLIMTAEFDAAFDVEVLASAFNMDKAEFLGHRVLIDNFGPGLENVVAALVDRNWFMIFDQLDEFEEFKNGEGLYWNYWFHKWDLWSTSRFNNAVLFTTDTNSVTGVSVTPNAPTVTKGTTQQFTATVSGTGFYPKTVVWSVSGGTASSIDANGLLTVGASEGAGPLTVTATSTYDESQKGTATVTLA